MRTRTWVALAVMAVNVTAWSPRSRPAADMIVTRARVWTGDAVQAEAKGVAMIADRIVAVGDVDEIERWRGSATRVIDAGGRLVVPGFNDAHVPFVDGGSQLDNVDLKDADTRAELARRIGERAKTTPAGEWIVGGNWDDQQWSRIRVCRVSGSGEGHDHPREARRPRDAERRHLQHSRREDQGREGSDHDRRRPDRLSTVTAPGPQPGSRVK